MKKSLIFAILLSVAIPQSTSANVSLAKKKEMINTSIQNYRGNCPCPYSRMKNGRICGKNSAWSRPGGASPLCYASDIK